MADKNILVVIKSKPYTTLNSYEAMRVAVGLWEHAVKVVWTGDGVYSLLKGADHSLTQVFHRDLPELDIEAYADGSALSRRGLTEKDILPRIEIADRAKVVELMMGAEVSLVF